MSRLPYAAVVLIAQVSERHKRSTVGPFGDPDGLDVYRTIRFNKSTARWLTPLLEAIRDPRIANIETVETGHLLVTFIPGPLADHRDPFPLSAASDVTK